MFIDPKLNYVVPVSQARLDVLSSMIVETRSSHDPNLTGPSQQTNLGVELQKDLDYLDCIILGDY